jgi:hypothetical protein
MTRLIRARAVEVAAFVQRTPMSAEEARVTMGVRTG